MTKHLYIEDETHQEMKEFCTKNNITLTQLIRLAISQYTKNNSENRQLLIKKELPDLLYQKLGSSPLPPLKNVIDNLIISIAAEKNGLGIWQTHDDFSGAIMVATNYQEMTDEIYDAIIPLEGRPAVLKVILIPEMPGYFACACDTSKLILGLMPKRNYLSSYNLWALNNYAGFKINITNNT